MRATGPHGLENEAGLPSTAGEGILQRDSGSIPLCGTRLRITLSSRPSTIMALIEATTAAVGRLRFWVRRRKNDPGEQVACQDKRQRNQADHQPVGGQVSDRAGPVAYSQESFAEVPEAAGQEQSQGKRFQRLLED